MQSFSSRQLFIEGIFKFSPVVRAGSRTGIFGIKQSETGFVLLGEPVSVSCGFGGVCPRSRGADDLIKEPCVLPRGRCCGANSEDWTITRADQSFGLRAEQQTFDPSPPMCSQDNKVSIMSFGERQISSLIEPNVLIASVA